MNLVELKVEVGRERDRLAKRKAPKTVQARLGNVVRELAVLANMLKQEGIDPEEMGI